MVKKTDLAQFDTVVNAILPRLPVSSQDGRTNVWAWVCGHCGYDKNPMFDTRLNFASYYCDRCGTHNKVDSFNAELDRLEGKMTP